VGPCLLLAFTEEKKLNQNSFESLGVAGQFLRALTDVGYEQPTPIQARAIPTLLEGRDLLGVAQTGTGKTAAFALPLLSRIDLARTKPQVLVLTPTRELAIQVSAAFERYASQMKGFRIVPIYGGQEYRPQLQALRRGAHVIVGTPGRVIDHMDRGTLKLDALICLVLDEADEMLRMGFIEDVEKVLKSTPPTRQVALFSATMPAVIRRIAQTYLKSPVEITIRNKTSTVANTRQRYWMVSGGVSKLDGLTRILEAEPFDAMLVFVRTRQETADLASRMQARGFNAAPPSGEIEQKMRERTVNRPKRGDLDIIVATDVAARGLDVARISHVINYDVPSGTESSVHRIGRTGRAGRSGEAFLFVMPRERHMLRIIERATRQSIAAMELPSAAEVNEQRLAKLMDRISDILSNPELATGLVPFKGMVKQYQQTHQASPLDIAAALGHIAQGDTPLLIDAPSPRHRNKSRDEQRDNRCAPERERARRPRSDDPATERLRRQTRHGPKAGMEVYRIEVGNQHGVNPANIVGAIANEAGIGSDAIGRITIFDRFSTVDLPVGMPRHVLNILGSVFVAGRKLQISRVDKSRPRSAARTAGKRPLPRSRPKPAVE